jgi:ssDNA-binding Zn-finger/Zn-ribbon topoisomerase 1
VMKRRVAGRGAKAGQPFWGCSRYPSCRAIVPIG